MVRRHTLLLGALVFVLPWLSLLSAPPLIAATGETDKQREARLIEPEKRRKSSVLAGKHHAGVGARVSEVPPEVPFHCHRKLARRGCRDPPENDGRGQSRRLQRRFCVHRDRCNRRPQESWPYEEVQ